MTEFFRQQMFNIIAAVFLGLFVAVWGAVLLRVGFWVPDSRTVAPPLWLFKGTASTDLIGAFALSLLGWLIGAAGVVFQTEKQGS